MLHQLHTTYVEFSLSDVWSSALVRVFVSLYADSRQNGVDRIQIGSSKCSVNMKSTNEICQDLRLTWVIISLTKRRILRNLCIRLQAFKLDTGCYTMGLVYTLGYIFITDWFIYLYHLVCQRFIIYHRQKDVQCIDWVYSYWIRWSQTLTVLTVSQPQLNLAVNEVCSYICVFIRLTDIHPMGG